MDRKLVDLGAWFLQGIMAEKSKSETLIAQATTLTLITLNHTCHPAPIKCKTDYSKMS